MRGFGLLLAILVSLPLMVDRSFAAHALQPVDGACGSADGIALFQSPTIGLCFSGISSVASGNGPWTWNCAGSQGGATVQCSTLSTKSNSSATRVGFWWQPSTAAEWQWMISHPLDVTSESDMGTGKTAYNGATAPSTDPMVYDIDGFDNPASTVAALHSLGKRVICYIEVGAGENYRPDYSQFPATALGRRVTGYPSERYVDIRNPTVVQIIKARIQMCANKGFDAIEPDVDDSYAVATGFPLTKTIEEAYMTDLAAYAHSLGVAMFGKNPDDTGDSYASDMYNAFDGIITEQCNQYRMCRLLNSYTGKKAVFNGEYMKDMSKFCPADAARPGWNGTKFPVSLAGGRKPCK